MNIITIYDNIRHNNNFKTDWGFGCVIDHPKARILFDTGAKPEILEYNLKVASIDPKTIDIVIVSHKHWDHKGGVLWLAQKNPNAQFYISKTFSKKLEVELLKLTKNVNIIKENLSVMEYFHIIVSENFWIRELALIIKTSQGNIIVTGCSHTGIQNITQKAQGKENIIAIFGGFHLFRSSEQKIIDITENLKKMNVMNIAPCHCTGEKAIKILQKEFSENFLHNGVGATFSFEE